MHSAKPMELFYKRYGDGPPLIVLHGLLGASGNWHTLSSTAFGNHFTVYAVDLRNHGRSPHSDVFDYPAMAEDLHALVQQHGLEQPHLLGHSMGGKAAMQYALTYPDQIGRLVVVDIAPKAYPPHHAAILDALQSLNLETLDARTAIDEALAEKIPSVGVRQFLLKNLDYDREAERYFWKMNLGGIAKNYAHLNVALAAAQPFEGPALFVRGGNSNYVTEDDESGIRQLFPQARLVTIDGAGHWVHADQPKMLAEVVLAFL